MLRLTIVSPALAANCFVLAADGARECAIIDPGFAIADELDAALTQHDLTPQAILITHGHIDHIASVPSLAEKYDIPVYVHADDAYRLDDPIATLSPSLSRMLGTLAEGWRPPSHIRHISGAVLSPPTSPFPPPLDLAGLTIRAIHAPGHTEGSTLYYSTHPGENALFTGDVLFKGTIGRTDLPGGDPQQMAETLRMLALPPDDGGLPDATSVFAGHGEPTDLGHERKANPFLTS